jgi:DNA helicase-2/ATP-dependent DNA helicase PcrA
MLTADSVLDALDPEQRAVATALRGPVCVLAGAGTGKTRAMTHRIAYGVHAGVYAAPHVLAVTFTARAAGEMRSRLRELGVAGVQARTFHAAALRQLNYFWPRSIGGTAPSVMEHKAGLVAEAASRLRISVDRPAIRDLSGEIEWAKVALLTPQNYAVHAQRASRGTPGGLDLTAMARLMEVYEQVKSDRHVIDFEDVLLLTAGILESDQNVAGAVRQQYRHFVVDEYQDVSALQQRLLDLWVADRRDLCVVGDPNQTIYSFTGASPEHLLGFTKRYPDATVVKLERDYRSTPQVVGLANALLARAGQAGGGPGAPPASTGPRAATTLELRAQRPPGPLPTLRVHEDDVAEAVATAALVAGWRKSGLKLSEIAILFRTNAQSESLEQALAQADVPYVVRGGERFFQRKEVRDAVLLLRGSARSHAPEEGESLGDGVRMLMGNVGWTPEAPASSGALRDRWESLQALAVLADELAASRSEATLGDFVAELEERASAQHAPTVEGVTLASLHAAKGLEWDAVCIVGVSEGLMPISLADGWSAVEEERRLLYVGVTRAREHLCLSWARARTPGGRASRSPSRFLDGIPGRVLDGAAGPGAGKSGGKAAGGSAGKRDGANRDGERSGRGRTAAVCRSCGSALVSGAERKIGRCSSCPSTYDEELFERLRAWRLETAQEAKVPAFVVFTDATLVAVAEQLPADQAGLARIPGIGSTKIERYGPAVLQVLAGSRPDRETTTPKKTLSPSDESL